MGCQYSEKIESRVEYDMASDTYMCLETHIRQYIGVNAYISAQAYWRTLVVGSTKIADYGSPGTTIYSIIQGTDIRAEHERLATVTFTIREKSAGADNAVGFISYASSSLCVSDYDITKIPGGDTVYVDLGQHYKEWNFQATGYTVPEVQTLLENCLPSGKLIQANISKVFREDIVIGNALYHEPCNTGV